MSARSVTMQIVNETSLELNRTNASLSHGEWSTNRYPQASIGGNTKSSLFESQSDGFMTGTQGTVTYNNDFTFNWDDPFSGSNSIGYNVPKGYKCSQDISGDDNCTVIWTITNA